MAGGHGFAVKGCGGAFGNSTTTPGVM
jgi:hypothetical protein